MLTTMRDIVPRLAAALVLLLIGVVLTADAFCCADGCTDGHHTTLSTVSTCCSLCQNSVTVPSVSAGVRFGHGSRIAVIRLRSLGDCVLTTPAATS